MPVSLSSATTGKEKVPVNLSGGGGTLGDLAAGCTLAGLYEAASLRP